MDRKFGPNGTRMFIGTWLEAGEHCDEHVHHDMLPSEAAMEEEGVQANALKLMYQQNSHLC